MLTSVLVSIIFVILFHPSKPARITLPQFTVRKQAQGNQVPTASQRQGWDVNPNARTAELFSPSDLSRVGGQAGAACPPRRAQKSGRGLWLVQVLPGEPVLPLKPLPSCALAGWSLLYAS